MKAKCIAIGNRIMSDDGIGIKVLENIEAELKKDDIEALFGETDIDYALSCIENGDLLFILDSTCFNIAYGTVTYTPIEQSALVMKRGLYSQHQPNLISLLKTYQKSVTGYIIGIEAEVIDFGLDLSEALQCRLLGICGEILEFIQKIIN